VRAVSQRLRRVESLAREVLGELISTLKDPRVGFATVTAVRVSADLRHARVLIGVLGDEEEQQRTMDGLDSAQPFLRAELSRQMRLRYSPELTFELDRGAETAERVESILKRVRAEDAES
jgi:ribosome-binding factor A